MSLETLRKNFILRYWLPVVAYILLLLFLSSRPSDQIPSPFPYSDKVGHFFMYFAFSIVLSRWLFSAWKIPLNRCRVLALILCSAYGVWDELFQSLTPSRDVSALDWAFDVFGASMGAYAFPLYLRLKQFLKSIFASLL